MDYLSHITGIYPSSMTYAIPYKTAYKEIIRLLEKKKIVGHSVGNDLKIIGWYPHFYNQIIDISQFKQFKRLNGQKYSLKHLAAYFLGMKIQNGTHDSVEDARAAMELYRLIENEFCTDEQ